MIGAVILIIDQCVFNSGKYFLRHQEMIYAPAYILCPAICYKIPVRILNSIRIKMPDNETVSLTDMIRGDVHFDTSIVDDKVLLKADGMPT